MKLISLEEWQVKEIIRDMEDTDMSGWDKTEKREHDLTLATVKYQLSGYCAHEFGKLTESLLVVAETHDMPAEYNEYAECQVCGQEMKVEDIPDVVE